MTVNKDRANSWQASDPHTSKSCGGNEHRDIYHFDGDGAKDKHLHVEIGDIGGLIGVVKDLITGKGG